VAGFVTALAFSSSPRQRADEPSQPTLAPVEVGLDRDEPKVPAPPIVPKQRPVVVERKQPPAPVVKAPPPVPWERPAPPRAPEPVRPPPSLPGTKVEFMDNPAGAARTAAREEKLLFVLHVSGNFEDPQFT